jgi:hypothetical protein
MLIYIDASSVIERMPPPMHPYGFVLETVFTVIAVAFCWLIYFRTRETYELTQHRGIRYFRDAFLFFGLSYLVRFVLGIVLLSMIALDFFMPRGPLMPLLLLPLGYFSSMGIMFLLFSLMHKSFKGERPVLLGHLIAIAVSVTAFLTRSHFILLWLQCALLSVVVILSIVQARKFSSTRVLYLLVALLWLINLLIIENRRPFPPGLEVVFQLVSVIVFIMIYRKAAKWAH